jgi:hypothetical protein
MALIDDVGRELLLFLIWFVAMVFLFAFHYLMYVLLADSQKKVPVPDARVLVQARVPAEGRLLHRPP